MEQTPAQVFNTKATKLRFVGVEELRDAFLWEEDRKVRKDGCLSLHSIEFDAGPEFIGQTVELRYDRFDPTFAELWSNGKKIKIIYPKGTLSAHPTPALPDETTAPPKASRLLNVLEKQGKERRKQALGAISFRSIGGGSGV